MPRAPRGFEHTSSQHFQACTALYDDHTGMGAFWILRPRPLGSAGAGWHPAEALPPPRLLLVCFAPAGTSASLFLEWQVSLPDGVQLLAVELPGRGARMREAPLDSMPELMQYGGRESSGQLCAGCAFRSVHGTVITGGELALINHSHKLRSKVVPELLLSPAEGPCCQSYCLSWGPLPTCYLATAWAHG